MHLLPLSLLALVAAAGCRGIPSSDRVGAAEIGDAPEQVVAVTRATEVLRERLGDLDSARIGFDPIKRGFYAVATGAAAVRYAWMLTAWVDAKNAHGFYDGVKAHHFFFLSEKLVATAHPEQEWTGRSYRAYYAVTEFDGGGLNQEQAGLQPQLQP